MKTWQKIRQLRKQLKDITAEKFARLEDTEKTRIIQLRRAERLFTYQYDFGAFCLEVLHAEAWGQVPVKWAKLHHDLCRFLRSCKNLGVNAFILVPRYHLKTQICTIFYRIWRAVHDPELCSLIVSGTLELSKSTARTVRSELENNMDLRDLYRHVLPDEIFNDRKNKWSETQFSVRRAVNYPQCTVEAVGVDATVTGKHFGEISMDDMVTPENSTTPEQCNKVIQAFKYFISIINPKQGRFIVIGTPYTDTDLYNYIQEPEILKTFKFFIRPVYDSNRLPIWHEMFSEAKLDEIAVSQGVYMFSAQYLLDPVPEEQQEFKNAWIQFYVDLPRDVNDNEIYVQKYIIVDPITAKKLDSQSKDRGVVMVVGVDKTGNKYVLDYALFARAKESELHKCVLTMSAKWNCLTVGWESDAYQIQGLHNLKEYAKKEGVKLNVKEIRTKGINKDARIRGLIPLFERGEFYIKRWMNELAKELRRFPHGKTKDLIDALAYILQLVPAHTTSGQRFMAQQARFQSKKAFYK